MFHGRQNDLDNKLGDPFDGSNKVNSTNSCSLPNMLESTLGKCLGSPDTHEHV